MTPPPPPRPEQLDLGALLEIEADEPLGPPVGITPPVAAPPPQGLDVQGLLAIEADAPPADPVPGVITRTARAVRDAFTATPPPDEGSRGFHEVSPLPSVAPAADVRAGRTPLPSDEQARAIAAGQPIPTLDENLRTAVAYENQRLAPLLKQRRQIESTYGDLLRESEAVTAMRRQLDEADTTGLGVEMRALDALRTRIETAPPPQNAVERQERQALVEDFNRRVDAFQKNVAAFNATHRGVVEQFHRRTSALSPRVADFNQQLDGHNRAWQEAVMRIPPALAPFIGAEAAPLPAVETPILPSVLPPAGFRELSALQIQRDQATEPGLRAAGPADEFSRYQRTADAIDEAQRRLRGYVPAQDLSGVVTEGAARLPLERWTAQGLRGAITGVRTSAVGAAARYISNAIDDALGRERTSGPVEDLGDSTYERAVAMMTGLGVDLPILKAGGAVAGRFAAKPIIDAMARDWFQKAVKAGMSVEEAALGVQRAIGNSAAVKRLVEEAMPHWVERARRAGYSAAEAREAAEAAAKLVLTPAVSPTVRAAAGAVTGAGAVGTLDAVRSAALQLAETGTIDKPLEVAAHGVTGAVTGGLISGLSAPITQPALHMLAATVGWGVLAPVIQQQRAPTAEDLILAGIPAVYVYAATRAAARGAREGVEVLPPGAPRRGRPVGSSETQPPEAEPTGRAGVPEQPTGPGGAGGTALEPVARPRYERPLDKATLERLRVMDETLAQAEARLDAMEPEARRLLLDTAREWGRLKEREPELEEWEARERLKAEKAEAKKALKEAPPIVRIDQDALAAGVREEMERLMAEELGRPDSEARADLEAALRPPAPVAEPEPVAASEPPAKPEVRFPSVPDRLQGRQPERAAVEPPAPVVDDVFRDDEEPAARIPTAIPASRPVDATRRGIETVTAPALEGEKRPAETARPTRELREHETMVARGEFKRLVIGQRLLDSGKLTPDERQGVVKEAEGIRATYEREIAELTRGMAPEAATKFREDLERKVRAEEARHPTTTKFDGREERPAAPAPEPPAPTKREPIVGAEEGRRWSEAKKQVAYWTRILSKRQKQHDAGKPVSEQRLQKIRRSLAHWTEQERLWQERFTAAMKSERAKPEPRTDYQVGDRVIGPQGPGVVMEVKDPGPGYALRGVRMKYDRGGHTMFVDLEHLQHEAPRSEPAPTTISEPPAPDARYPATHPEQKWRREHLDVLVELAKSEPAEAVRREYDRKGPAGTKARGVLNYLGYDAEDLWADVRAGKPAQQIWDERQQERADLGQKDPFTKKVPTPTDTETPAPARTEPTPAGEQVLVPGTPTRTQPPGRSRPTTTQAEGAGPLFEAPGPEQVEIVEPGEKGVARLRTDKRIKPYLAAKRPAEDDVPRITSYRTEAVVGLNTAIERGAEQDIIDVLRREYEWAVGRLEVLAPDIDWRDTLRRRGEQREGEKVAPKGLDPKRPRYNLYTDFATDNVPARVNTLVDKLNEGDRAAFVAEVKKLDEDAVGEILDWAVDRGIGEAFGTAIDKVKVANLVARVARVRIAGVQRFDLKDPVDIETVTADAILNAPIGTQLTTRVDGRYIKVERDAWQEEGLRALLSTDVVVGEWARLLAWQLGERARSMSQSDFIALVKQDSKWAAVLDERNLGPQQFWKKAQKNDQPTSPPSGKIRERREYPNVGGMMHGAAWRPELRPGSPANRGKTIDNDVDALRAEADYLRDVLANRKTNGLPKENEGLARGVLATILDRIKELDNPDLAAARDRLAEQYPRAKTSMHWASTHPLRQFLNQTPWRAEEMGLDATDFWNAVHGHWAKLPDKLRAELGVGEAGDMPEPPPAGPAPSGQPRWRAKRASGREAAANEAAATLLNALDAKYDGKWPVGVPVSVIKELQAFRAALRETGMKRVPAGSNVEPEAKARATRETPKPPPAVKAPDAAAFSPKDPVQLERFVRSHGGIAPSPTGDLKGEYAAIHVRFKNRRGLTADKMAQAISEAWGQPYSDADLLTDLSKIQRAKAAQKAREGAAGPVEAEPGEPSPASITPNEISDGLQAPEDSEARRRTRDVLDSVSEVVDAAGDMALAKRAVLDMAPGELFITQGGLALDRDTYLWVLNAIDPVTPPAPLPGSEVEPVPKVDVQIGPDRAVPADNETAGMKWNDLKRWNTVARNLLSRRRYHGRVQDHNAGVVRMREHAGALARLKSWLDAADGATLQNTASLLREYSERENDRLGVQFHSTAFRTLGELLNYVEGKAAHLTKPPRTAPGAGVEGGDLTAMPDDALQRLIATTKDPARKAAAEEEARQRAGEPEWGQDNRVFTKDEYASARERLRNFFRGNRPTMGVDLSILPDLIKVGGFHFEAGLRTFAKWSERMVKDLGEGVRDYLRHTFDLIEVHYARETRGATGAPHRYSSTQVDLPPALGNQIIAWAERTLPKERLAPEGIEQRPHITVKYGLHTTKALPVGRVLAGAAKPEIRLGKMGVFRDAPEHDVLYIAVDSPDLHALNRALSEGLKHTTDHPTYTPHATVAYLQKGAADAFEGNNFFAGREVPVEAIRFTPADGSEVVDLPLLGAKTPETAPVPAAPGEPRYVHAARFGRLTAAFEQAIRGRAMPKDPREVRQLAARTLGLEERALRGDAALLDDVYDAIETAVNKVYVQRGVILSLDLAGAIQRGVETEKWLGTRTRTLELSQRQQFSTPLSIAEAAAAALDLRPDEVVLEPTAGTGNLLAALRRAPELVRANELDPRRAEALRLQGYEPTTFNYLRARDASLTLAGQPDVVLMNPPWGKYTTKKYGPPIPLPFGQSVDVAERFVVKALRDVRDGGRVAAVMPTTIVDSPNFLRWLGTEHTLRALVTNPPGSYDSRGTSVESVILVVDKGRIQDAPAPIRGAARDWAHLAELVGPLARGGSHSRVQPAAPAGRPAGQPGAAAPAAGPAGGRERPGGVAGRPAGDAAGRAPEPAGPAASAAPGDRGAGRVPEAGVPGVRGPAAPRAGGPGAGVVPGGRRGGDDAVAGGAAVGVRDRVPEDVELPPERNVLPARRGERYSVADPRELEAATRSEVFAPAPVRSSPGHSPHPRLIVVTRSLAGAELPPLTYEPQAPLIVRAYNRRLISDQQWDYGIVPALQANAADKAYLAAADVGVGKTRIAAAVAAEWFHTGVARRLLYVTASEVNVQDVRTQFDDFAGGEGQWPYEFVEVKAYKDSKETPKRPPEQVQPLPAPSGPAVFLVDRYNLAAFAHAIRMLAPDAIIGDEAHLLKNIEGANVGIKWLEIQKDAIARRAKVLYLTATPAVDFDDMQHLIGLREWTTESFEDYKRRVTGAAPEGSDHASLRKEFDRLLGMWKALKNVSEADKQALIAKLPDVDARGIPIERTVQLLNDANNLLREALLDKGQDAASVGGDADAVGVRKGASRSLFRGGDVFGAHITPGEQEQIMRELAMKGLYYSVDLWRAGVDFEVVTHEPSATEHAEYAQVADFMQRLNDAFYKFGRLNKGKKVFSIRSMLQIEAKRRIFDYRLPHAIARAEEALARGEQVVFSTISVNPTVADSGPIPSAINMINDRLVDPDQDIDEEIPEALQVRGELLDEWREIRALGDPIGKIKAAFGEKNVAAIIGATTAVQREQLIREFQAGLRKVAIISDAGKTGISLHHVMEITGAARGRRRLIVMDYDWSATMFKQLLGRVDRSGQLSAPAVDLLSSGLAGERKFTATIANRMRNLGALSKGSAESASNDKLAEFELGGNIDSYAMRKAYAKLTPEDQAWFMARPFKDPKGDVDPTTGRRRPLRTEPTEASLKEFLLDLQFMPMDVSNRIFERFWQERTEAIAAQTAQKELNLGGRTKTHRGRILRTTNLDKDLKLHEVQDEGGGRYAVLQGLITPRMTIIAPFLPQDSVSQRPLRPYITFSAGDEQVAGLEIRPGAIRGLKQAFGHRTKALETPEEVREALDAGDIVPLEGLSGQLSLKRRPSDGLYAIQGAKMADQKALLGNGASYRPVGDLFYVKPDNLARFLERFPVKQQRSFAPVEEDTRSIEELGEDEGGVSMMRVERPITRAPYYNTMGTGAGTGGRLRGPREVEAATPDVERAAATMDREAFAAAVDADPLAERVLAAAGELPGAFWDRVRAHIAERAAEVSRRPVPPITRADDIASLRQFIREYGRSAPDSPLGERVARVRQRLEELERTPGPRTAPPATEPQPQVTLVACCETKGAAATAAKDLYQSDWFKKARAYAETQPGRWFIVSALHGLVDPEQSLEPYNFRLSQRSADERGEWASGVVGQVARYVGPETKVVLLAGQEYAGPLEAEVRAQLGTTAERPLRGLGIGEQKAWLKRSTIAPGEQGVLFARREAAPPFYSALRQAIVDKMPESAVPQQVGSIAKSPGVKADEVKWTGLDDWLAAQTGKVSKADVLAFLDANQVRVVDDLRGEAEDLAAEHQQFTAGWGEPHPLIDAEIEAMDRDLLVDLEERGIIVRARIRNLQRAEHRRHAYMILGVPARGWVLYGKPTTTWEPIAGSFPALDDAREAAWEDRAASLDEDYPHQARAGQTQYESYTLKGGANYRELLLVWDRPHPAVLDARIRQLSKWPESPSVARRAEDQPELDRLVDEWEQKTSAYTSPHFHGAENVLAHVRFNERVDDKGRRVLHLEEVQSDWHEEGRRRGYRQTVDVDALRAENMGTVGGPREGYGIVWNVTGPGLPAEGIEVTAPNDLAARQRAAGRQEERGIPPAPFAKTWHELALRRMIRWAAEHDFDVITWTTGDQQADRYDLSKHVRRLRLLDNSSGGIGRPRMDGPFEQGLLTAIDHRGREVISQYVRSRDELDGLVGKEATDRLLAVEPYEGAVAGIGHRIRELEGLTLKLGGEGMRGFYDRILPQYLEKYAKKWGAEVTTTRLPLAAPVKVMAADDWQRQHPDARPVWPSQKWVVVAEDATDVVLNAFPARPQAERDAAVRNKGRFSAVHALPVTKAMKASVLGEGQPLFAADKETLDRAESVIQERMRYGKALRTGRYVPGTQHQRLADTSREGFDRAFMIELAERAPHVAAVTRELATLFGDLQKALQTLDPRYETTYLYGVSPDPEYYAVNVSGPRTSILINPWAAVEHARILAPAGGRDYDPAALAARVMARAMVHEFTHQLVKDHSEHFERLYQANLERARVVWEPAADRLAALLGGEDGFAAFVRDLDRLVADPSGAGRRYRPAPDAPAPLGPERPPSWDSVGTGVSLAAGPEPPPDLRRGQPDAPAGVPADAGVGGGRPELTLQRRGTRTFLPEAEAEAFAAELRAQGRTVEVRPVNAFIRAVWASEPVTPTVTPAPPAPATAPTSPQEPAAPTIPATPIPRRDTRATEAMAPAPGTAETLRPGPQADQPTLPGYRRPATGAEREEIEDKRRLILHLEHVFDVPIRIGRFNQRGARGIFKIKPEVIRIRRASMLGTAAHEIGHFLKKKNLIDPSGYEDQLAEMGEQLVGDDVNEGIAEFVRHYVEDPDYLVQHGMQGLVARFEATMQRDWPDGLAALLDARGKYVLWRNQPVAARFASIIDRSPKAMGWERLKHASFDQWWGRFYTIMFDDLHPIRLLEKVASRGEPIAADKSAYLAARLTRGEGGRAETFVNSHPIDFRTLKLREEIPGLKEILGSSRLIGQDLWAAPVWENRLEFEAYLLMRRTQELAGSDSPRLQKAGETMLGQVEASPQAVDEAIREMERDHPEFAEAAADLQKWNDALLDYIGASGRYDPGTIGAIKKLHRHYVPFYRVFEEWPDDISVPGGGNRFADLPSPIKRLKGSERRIVSPLESLLKNAYAMIAVADRNEVGNLMIDLVERTEGYGKLMEHVPPKMQATRFMLSEIQEFQDALQEAGVDPEQYDIDLDRIATIFRPVWGRERDVILLWRNGAPQKWQVDPWLYRAMMNLDRFEMPFLARIFEIPARVFRAGVVLNPIFQIRNFLRDQMTVGIQSRGIPFFGYGQALVNALTDGKLEAEWKAAGGAIFSNLAIDRPQLERRLQEVMEGKGERVAGLLDLRHPVEAGRAWLRMLSDITEFSESPTRQGVFRRAYEAPRPEDVGSRRPERARRMRAAFEAREASVDFRRGGAIRAFTRLVAFLGPTLQGLDKFVRTHGNHPFKMALVGALMILTEYLLHQWNKTLEGYDSIPSWQRDIFFVVGVPGAGGVTWLRIPGPFEYKLVYSSIPRRIFEWLDGTHPEEGWKDLAGSLYEAVERSGFNPIPTFALPLIENLANWNFFTERPIEPRGLEDLAPAERFTRSTSEVAKAIGGALDYSPAKIDHLLQGYGGTLTRELTSSIDALLRDTAYGEPPTTPVADWPLIRGFVIRTPNLGSDHVERFYEYRQQAIQAKRTLDKLKRENRPTAQWEREHAWELAIYSSFEAEARRFSEMRKGMVGTERDARLSGDQKREALDRIARDLIGRAKQKVQGAIELRKELEKGGR